MDPSFYFTEYDPSTTYVPFDSAEHNLPTPDTSLDPRGGGPLVVSPPSTYSPRLGLTADGNPILHYPPGPVVHAPPTGYTESSFSGQVPPTMGPPATPDTQHTDATNLFPVSPPNEGRYGPPPCSGEESRKAEEVPRASCNGFLNSLVSGYSKSLCVVIRPDDVWLAIITHLSSQMNITREPVQKIVRALVAREIVIDWNEPNYLEHAVSTLERRLKGGLRAAQLIPAFTTTEKKDQDVARVVMMSMFKGMFYLKIENAISAALIQVLEKPPLGPPIEIARPYRPNGFYSVQLLGSQEDYAQIIERLEVLEVLNEGDSSVWAKAIKETVDGFVKSFDAPEAYESKTFFNMDMSKNGRERMKGWIAAFCYFGTYGKRKNPRLHVHSIPDGTVRIPLVVRGEGGQVIPAEIIAGSYGIQLYDSKVAGLGMVQPVSHW